jgi:hypothetical protein
MITVAGGRFAPGHLGELTQTVPFEMVDAALDETGKTEKRVRDLPSRVVVYLLLAAALFPGPGYGQVWKKLTSGLDGLDAASPTEAAMARARSRVGPAPLRALFDLLRGPAARLSGKGVYWRGRLVAALDGTTLACPASEDNLAVYTRGGGSHGGTGYPMVRLLALVACGTRTVVDAVFGPTCDGETTYARRLLPSMRKGMIVLMDRGFACQKLVAAIAGTEADVLVRVKNSRRLPVCRRFGDGSFLSRMGAAEVRVVICEITIATEAGRQTGLYTLVTTVLDPNIPAAELVRLYHERWEIETAYLEIKSTILGGRVLRARTPAGVEQEIYALLCAYQALRTAMADATATRLDVDPDRASFTVALNTARDQLVKAADVMADTAVDLVGTIGRHVLDALMPDRRLRVTPRVVKRAISKFVAKGNIVRGPSYKATLNIDIIVAPEVLTASPSP